MFSSLYAMGSSTSHSTGMPGNWERLFLAGSQDVSLSVLTEPALQTDTAADSRSSLPLVSSLSKITLLQRAVSSCADVFILHFPPLGLFFLSPTSSEFLLFEATEIQTGNNFSTHIPFLQCYFSYRMYRICFQLFFLTS